MQFLKLAEGEKLSINDDMLKRAVNVGFSGGEKKRNEILQMAVLEPTLAILDETDSGLDIDALKLVSDGVNALRSEDRGMLMITHYQRLLDLHPAGSRPCPGTRQDPSPAARNWRSSWKRPATPTTRRPEGAEEPMADLTTLVDGFRQASSEEPGWLSKSREESRSRFNAHGMPTRRTESWKYTRLGALAKMGFTAAEERRGRRPSICRACRSRRSTACGS